MAKGQIDQALTELAALRNDDEGRRDVLHRVSLSMLHRPALGGQLLARLCAAKEGTPELEILADLLDAGLEAARMARENQKRRGDAFLDAVEEAIGLAAGQGALRAAHRFILARIWSRNGLQAPAVLELTDDDADPPEGVDVPGDPAALAAMLNGLLDEMTRQVDGDALELYAALTESFPAMPALMRDHVVACCIARPGPIHAKLACFWLLDPSPALRRAAADGLAARLGRGELTGDVSANLVILRSWMPDDEARRRVDQLLRDALRSGVAAAAAAPPWTLHGVTASLPDGGGAQSVALALQSGRSRKLAMLLLKQGHGVKDAYVVPCASATEQRSLLKQLEVETGAVKVPLAWLERAVAGALAEGLARGNPPAPGLIEVAGLCGLGNLRPEPATTGDLIARLAAAPRIAALSAQARGKLVNASEGWWERHHIVQSWFEESDSAQELLDQPRSPRALDSALWAWLETRRDWWARIVAHAAALLEAAGHADADSFVATALALRDGRDLKKIPVMADVQEQTIKAWAFDDPDADTLHGHDDPMEMDDMPPPPKPERKGELAKLLKGSAFSADWIDGYLMAIVLAPKPIMPSRWFPDLLGSVVDCLAPTSIQRFIELVMMRANGALTLAGDRSLCADAMGKWSGPAMRDWAAGFTNGQTRFKSSWPARTLAPDDKALLRMVAEAATAGFDGGGLRTLGQWIAVRFAGNQRGL